MIWWTKSWNPIIGCTKCSPACENCYAEATHTMRHKALLAGKRMPSCYAKPFDQVRVLPERLTDPLHWKKPQRIFVGNMGDLFHEDVTDLALDHVFAAMAMASPAHTFMLCTKRPERMAEYLGHPAVQKRIYRTSGKSDACCLDWPLPNVWLGTTIWDQASADRAVPILLSTPAAKRFVSVEPMLGPVDLRNLSCGGCTWIDGLADERNIQDHLGLPGLDWVICGGETGPGARPMHPAWPRSLRDQCLAAGVPFMFKQWGEWGDMPWRVFAEKCVAITPDGQTYSPDAAAFNGEGLREDATLRCRVGHRRAGRALDGGIWEEVPNA